LEAALPKAAKQVKTRSADPAGAGPVLSTATGVTLDRYDVAILDALQRDARQSNADLAATIGLSAAPTWRRVRRLEELGVITGYRAEVDRRKIGLGVLAFVRVDTDRDNAAATQAPRRWKPRSGSCPRSSPATTSAAPAPSSCRCW
jgi:Lrp/AsnC family transcriptional regulator, leucine-responsive regulatory protein